MLAVPKSQTAQGNAYVQRIYEEIGLRHRSPHVPCAPTGDVEAAKRAEKGHKAASRAVPGLSKRGSHQNDRPLQLPWLAFRLGRERLRLCVKLFSTLRRPRECQYL